MAKILDITDKLSFDENPRLKVKDKELEVNADAATVLKIMGILGDGKDVTPTAVSEMCNLIFSEDGIRVIGELHLQFKDFQTLIFAAINLITGDNGQGEQ